MITKRRIVIIPQDNNSIITAKKKNILTKLGTIQYGMSYNYYYMHIFNKSKRGKTIISIQSNNYINLINDMYDLLIKRKFNRHTMKYENIINTYYQNIINSKEIQDLIKDLYEQR